MNSTTQYFKPNLQYGKLMKREAEIYEKMSDALDIDDKLC